MKKCTNKLTNSSALLRHQVAPRLLLGWARAPLAVPAACQAGEVGARNASHTFASVWSLTQEICLCCSAGSTIPFAWEAKGSSPTPEIWLLPNACACIVMEGGLGRALGKGALSLWFFHGNGDQRSKSDTRSLSLVGPTDLKDLQRETGKTIGQSQAFP